jgi:hypothetical protein
MKLLGTISHYITSTQFNFIDVTSEQRMRGRVVGVEIHTLLATTVEGREATAYKKSCYPFAISTFPSRSPSPQI